MMRIDVFGEIVSADIKGKATPEQQEILRRPESLLDWQAELIKIINTVHAQIEDLDRRAKLDLVRYDGPGNEAMLAAAQQAWERQRHQKQKFLYHADSTLLMVDQLVAAANKDQRPSTERENFLEQAILAHLAANENLDENDQNLYDALGGQWKFYEEVELPFEPVE